MRSDIRSRVHIPWRLFGARGMVHVHLFLVEVRSVSRNRLFTLSFLGNLLLVPFLLYFGVYREEQKEPGLTFMWTALLAAIPAANYAGFCIGKDAYYLEGYLTRHALKEYVHGKIAFSRAYTALYAGALFPCTLFGSSDAVFAFCAAAVYYVGFGGLFQLYMATFGTARIDLHVSPFFTVQQTSVLGALAVFPVTTPLFFMDISSSLALALTWALGALGFVLSEPMQHLIERNVARRKYKILGL